MTEQIDHAAPIAVSAGRLSRTRRSTPASRWLPHVARYAPDPDGRLWNPQRIPFRRRSDHGAAGLYSMR